MNIKPLEASPAEVNASSKPSPAKVNASSKPSSAQVSLSGRHGYEANASFSNHAKGGSINAAINTLAAVNQRNDEASLSSFKVAGKIISPEDGMASARTTKTSPSQTEGKVTPRLPSYESLLHTKDAMHVSTTQLGERPVGVVPGAINERLGSGISLAEEYVTASSTNDTSERALAKGPSEGSAALEDKDQAESKKRSFAVSFPVTIFSDWWFSCFSQGHRPYYTCLNHPLNKVYVWLAAYQRVHFDVTGHYTDALSAAILMKQLLNLQNAVLDGKFRWGDRKTVYLPIPVGNNEEPLSNITSFPSFQDRVVNEILYLVLEPIFESRFSARSHGFRPGRDTHTALRAAQRSCQGCTWFIRGNLSLLHEEIYTTHLVDSALRVVRDTRFTFLLKSGFLGDMSEQEGSTHVCMFADQGPCSKLRNLLCNVFLDQLDWLMDEQISSFSKREQPSTHSTSSFLFKPERVKVERPRKLEYIRYGTEILVACNGTREEAELVGNSIKSYFKQKFSMDFGNVLIISHISDGVKFLDHVISQKIVHPIVSCRRASSGRVFEKRAHRIRLCVKASTECCLMYLKQIETPTSLQHIEEILLILDNWYQCADNKDKVMQYCKMTLCHLYAKGVIEKHKEQDFAEQFKEAMHMIVYDQMKRGDSDKANPMQNFVWVPEHENVLRDHAWLQSKSWMSEVASFKNTRKVSPQQYMSQVLWQYLGGSNGDNSWEPDVQMQTSCWGRGDMVETKLEDFAESVG